MSDKMKNAVAHAREQISEMKGLLDSMEEELDQIKPLRKLKKKRIPKVRHWINCFEDDMNVIEAGEILVEMCFEDVDNLILKEEYFEPIEDKLKKLGLINALFKVNDEIEEKILHDNFCAQYEELIVFICPNVIEGNGDSILVFYRENTGEYYINMEASTRENWAYDQFGEIV